MASSVMSERPVFNVGSEADPLARAIESREHTEWHPTGRICLMEIGSSTGTGPTRFRNGLYPFGCFTDQIGTFVRVRHWVDFRHAALTRNEHGPKQQAWPCHMRIGIQLVSGRQSPDFSGIDTQEDEAVYFHLPAKYPNGSDGIQTEISDLKACNPVVESGDVKDGTIRNHLKRSNEKEAATIQRMIEEKTLYEIEIKTAPRNLAPSNVFVRQSEHSHFQTLVDAVKTLHQRPEITSLTFRLIFCCPNADEERSNWITKVQRSIDNFRKAQKMENKGEKWPGELYVKNAGRAFHTQMGLYKEIGLLPLFVPPHFDVAPSVQNMILMHGLDLHYLYEQERAKLKSLEDGVFEARFLELNNGQNQTYGCFIRIGEKQPGVTALVKGLAGHITFPGHEDTGKRSFTLSRLPLVAGVKDVFLVVYVETPTDKLPCTVIDLKKGTAEQDLAELISASDFVAVKLHGKYTNVTEVQQWKGLQAINPKMNGTGKAAEIAQYVCRILAGHGLENVGRRSVWTVDVQGYIEPNLQLLDERFAEAIGQPGAILSKDQIRVIEYFGDAPEDRLLVIDGFAGTRKSSTMALLVCLLQMFQQTARVLVLAKMHKTINAAAETMIPIVENFLQKRVVRDWSDKTDMYLLIWILKGRPRDFDATWTVHGSVEEQGDLIDLMDCAEEAIEIIPGTSAKAPKSAIRRTVVWQMLERLKEMELINVLSEGPQQGSKRARTEEDNNQAGPAKSRKISTECIDESKQALASQEPELHPNNWKFRLHDLLRRIVDRLDQPWKKADEREVLKLLREIKSQWIEEFCGVYCSTISRLNSQEVRDYAATHVFMEEAQSVDDHDMKLMLAEFAEAWKILVGDSKQPGPRVKDGKFNKFSVVRRESTLKREVRRGRHHVKLTKSGQM
ncbi:MAG: hypothetical protein GOMPHAMPRED_004805 [Gomphillus americanus]|uniref:Uncharacterized protein n=1 Tax=Gomphillus americanus TaxID=1940652 RepID=A0A8H3EM57_9LECA|nr:MAG: hypothetical protein GOMPHAMPRED_004805 [Gomphillus americanus]